MCELRRSFIVRALPFLLTFCIGLAIAIYFRSYAEDLLIRAVPQEKVLAPSEIVRVPDADIPDSLRQLHLDRAATKLRAAVNGDGKVTDLRLEHTLYLKHAEDQSSQMSLETYSMLQTELESILLTQVRDTVFTPLSPSDQNPMEILVGGEFIPSSEMDSSKGCSQIVLTFQSADGRVLWQGNTERHRTERCFEFSTK